MATSGTLYSSYYSINSSSKIRIKITWSASQSVANNTSTVSWTAKADCTTSTGWAETWNASSVTLNGTKYNIANGTKCYNNTQVASGSFTVSHSSTGTGSFSWRINVNFATGGAYNSTGSGTVTLDTIARASSISTNKSSVPCGQTATLTISRASSSFTHTVTISYNSTVVQTLATKTSATSLSFTPALSTYAPKNTTGLSLDCVITCTTYSGSTSVGSKTASITVTIPSSEVTPTITMTSPTEQNSKMISLGWGIFVQSQSTVKITASASGKQGATIKSYSLKGGKSDASQYSSTSSALTTGALTVSGTNKFTASATDSRGVSTSTASQSITVVAWSAPTIRMTTCRRSGSSGEEDDSGTYLYIEGNSTFSACSNGTVDKNSATIIVSYKLYGSDTWTEVYSVAATNGDFSFILGDGTLLDIEKAYDIQVSITDTFTTSSTKDVISTSQYTMVLRHGGNGIAFGKASEMDGALESAYAGYFYNGIYGKQSPMDASWINVLSEIITASRILGPGIEIPQNSNINSNYYWDNKGVYVCSASSNTRTITGWPTDYKAGKLYVFTSLGDGDLTHAWAYVNQFLITYDAATIWSRLCSTDGNKVRTISAWKKISFT